MQLHYELLGRRRLDYIYGERPKIYCFQRYVLCLRKGKEVKTIIVRARILGIAEKNVHIIVSKISSVCHANHTSPHIENTHQLSP
jgi:hypothetical protein